MYRSAPTDRFCFFLLLTIFLLPTNLYAFQQDNEPVRVRVLRDISPRTIIISSSKTANLYSGDPTNPIAQLKGREKLTLTTSNNQVYLRLPEGSIYARSLIIDQQSDAEITIEVAEAAAIVSPRMYKGAFMIQVDPSTPSTLSIVNEVGLDDYVEGVLASEFNFNELEASKALAVCIRTLAYRSMANQHGPDYAIPDNELLQVYKGAGSVTNTVMEAVEQTKGEVLRFNGELIEAVYFASSGGRTANNEDVWHASRILPYLRGKDDPYDFNSPHHSWESTISRDRLLRHLGDKYRFKASGIKILGRSRDGRIQNIAVTGPDNREESMSGNDFRLYVNEQFGRETLRSTLFEVNVQPSMYIFSGKGFGHGVGLNQWGALQLSKKGNRYDEILAYYYNDVDIDKGGLVSRMLTATEGIIDDASAYIFDEEDNYNPSIQPAGISGNTSTINTQSTAVNDVNTRLFGDEDFEDDFSEEAVEEKPKSRRLFRRLRDRNKKSDDTTTTKKTPQPRPSGKRIGW